jgi:hypothetical protein
MAQILIRCHPCAPVSSDDVEQWLEHQAATLREEDPGVGARVARMVQPLPSGDRVTGWWLELDIPAELIDSIQPRLLEVLADMHLLGLHAAQLTPVEVPLARAA